MQGYSSEAQHAHRRALMTPHVHVGMPRRGLALMQICLGKAQCALRKGPSFGHSRPNEGVAISRGGLTHAQMLLTRPNQNMHKCSLHMWVSNVKFHL